MLQKFSVKFIKKTLVVLTLGTVFGSVTILPAHAASNDVSAPQLQTLIVALSDLTTLLNNNSSQLTTNGATMSMATASSLESQTIIEPGGSSDVPGLKANPKILFVGNSYTYAAPGAVRAQSPYGMFMRMMQLKAPAATSSLSAIGSSVMSELWNWTGKPVRTDPKTLLKTRTYDLLVLQSGDGILSKTVPGDYEIYADKFINLAKENGTDVMLYGVWAPDSTISISKGETVATNADVHYKGTVARNNVGYAAQGMAYTQAHKKFTELYGNGDDGQAAELRLTYDAVHAAAPTAYLAANMMYLAAFGVNPPTPSEFLPSGVTQSEAGALQLIAITAHNTHSTQLTADWYQ